MPPVRGSRCGGGSRRRPACREQRGCSNMHETSLPSENNDACDQRGSGLERGPVCMSAVEPEASARSSCQGEGLCQRRRACCHAGSTDGGCQEDTRVVRRTSKAERQGPQNQGPRRPSRSPLRPAAAPSSYFLRPSVDLLESLAPALSQGGQEERAHIEHNGTKK